MKTRRKAVTVLVFLLIAFLIGFWMDRAAQRTIEEFAMKTLEVYIQRYSDQDTLSVEDVAQIDEDSRMHGYYLYMRKEGEVIYSNAMELVRETPSPGTGVSVYRSKHLGGRVLLVRSELGRGSMRLYLPLQVDWPISLWIPAVSTILLLVFIREYVEESAGKKEWETVSLRVRGGEPLSEWEEAPSYAAPLLSSVERRIRSSEEKLQQMMEDSVQMEAILQSVETGVVALDENYRVFLMNPAAARMLHISREEALGKDVLLLLRDNEFDDALENYRKSGELPAEPFHLRLGGRDLSVRLSSTLYSAFESGITLAIEDTTEFNKLLTMRREFVANVSHELRTPLTSIKGFTETLMNMEVDAEKSKRFLRILDSEVNRLEGLIMDLEILSSIEKQENHPVLDEIFYPSAAVKDEKGLLEALFAQHPRLNLEMDIEESRRTTFGSSGLFRQLVYNLCENAVKYAKPSGGHVVVRLREEENNGVLVVEDDGIGIPQKDVERIFERFYRVDRSRSPNISGTGLGLAIVKHIAITFGGEIQVKSKLGKGTSFTFTFPLAEFTRN